MVPRALYRAGLWLDAGLTGQPLVRFLDYETKSSAAFCVRASALRPGPDLGFLTIPKDAHLQRAGDDRGLGFNPPRIQFDFRLCHIT